MSEPDENDDLPFARSAIAAIGARRRWRLFGKDETPADTAADPGAGEEAPATRSMLGSLASRRGPEPRVEPERRSVLSLDGAASAGAGAEEEPLVGPLTAHSTLGELAGLEEHAEGSLPIERGILISLVVHLLLVVLLITLPAHVPTDPKTGLLAAFVPQETDNSPIPVIFQESPGQARPNPKRSPLSDADRRAAGGDPARPRAESPSVPPSRGIAGLDPGPRAPRVRGGDAAGHPGAGAEAERRAALEHSKSTDAKPSEFPADMRPQMGAPSREISRLAGLDRVIQEAARSAVGGEGGAPPGNPDGGFVDSGPLSFDTKWYDWGPYAAEMVRRIKLHWDVPDLARQGWKGSLTVRFYILADGRVADARILRSSGTPPFDFAAFQAILKSSAFRPLPADLNSTREGVTVTFFYNMRPEDGETPGKSGKDTP